VVSVLQYTYNCIYTYSNKCTNLYINVHTYISIHICTCMYTIYSHIYIHIDTYRYGHICTCRYTYLHTHIYTYISTFIHLHIHIHTNQADRTLEWLASFKPGLPISRHYLKFPHFYLFFIMFMLSLFKIWATICPQYNTLRV